MMPTIVPWLRRSADPLDLKLLDQIMGYEALSDGEMGCSHSAEQIERGECTIDPDKVPAVQILFARYGSQEVEG
jgi:hypothetical protein